MLHIFILEVVTFPARLQVNTQSMIFFNLRLTFGQELWLGEISATCNDLKKIFLSSVHRIVVTCNFFPLMFRKNPT